MMNLLEENPVLIVVVVLVVLYLLVGRNEGHQNVTADKLAKRYQYTLGPKAASCPSNVYNPRGFQPAIAEQVADDNFIELNKNAETPWAKNVGPYGAVQGETDALGPVDLGLNFNMCSKNCCSAQWPTPFAMTPDDFVLRSGKEYVSSSYKCNNGWQDSGCVCLEKDQALFLNRRGNNSYSEI
jgi:hypothetical protein